MTSNSQVSFYVDTLLVETVLADDKFYKKGGFVTDLLTKVKDYFMAHIDKEHPVESVLKILAPGALWFFMQSIGLGKWGFFLGALVDYLHIDIPGILGSMFGKVKDMISGGKKVSSAQVDAATNEVEQQHAGNQADDHEVYSSLELLKDARIIRLAMIEYEHEKLRLTKEGQLKSLLFGSTKARSTSLFVKILGWIVKLALFSGGLMLAGDAVHALLGEPSALTGTYQEGKTPPESTTPAAPVAPVSRQTKFPLKADAPLSMSWPMTNTPSNIEEMIVQFAKDVYSGLDGKENLIKSSPTFQNVKDDIEWFNVHNPGTSVIFLPRRYPTKKSMVDLFIDEVAKAAP